MNSLTFKQFDFLQLQTFESLIIINITDLNYINLLLSSTPSHIISSNQIKIERAIFRGET